MNNNLNLILNKNCLNNGGMIKSSFTSSLPLSVFQHLFDVF